MSATKLSASDVLLLDNALLKAPIDQMRKVHKATQKTFEYNLGPQSSFQKELDDLLRKTASSSSSSSSLPDTTMVTDDTVTRSHVDPEALKKVDTMLAKMRGLKRKLKDLSTQSNQINSAARARVSYLSNVPDTTDDPSFKKWSRTRLSYHLTDYCLRSSPPLMETAKTLAKEERIDKLVDFDLWQELHKAQDGLKQRQLDQVLAWVNDNKVALRKSKSSLEFMIHLQAYIELCRERKLVEAIAYVKKHLSASAVAEMGSSDGQSSTHLTELSRAMALLAYAPDTSCQPYQELYSDKRWTSLLDLFRATFLELHSLPAIPVLHMSLQAGIASLKTPICCPVPNPPSTSGSNAWSSNGSHAGSTTAVNTTTTTTTTLTATEMKDGHIDDNVSVQPRVHSLEGQPSLECPICSSPLHDLAPAVPYSHHVNSTIVCGITGKVVQGDSGEGASLVALVSRVTGEGRVYSKEGLVMKASEHPQGKIVEPVTGEVFEWDDLKKVFIS
ncbi:GID complex subunit containing RING finger motif [Microbotryomycetes sp. JL221]|nr:GID complex subunit containing RING finger motif [Microbotryomycetes sp. JL221]